jgi:hypothetical protein
MTRVGLVGGAVEVTPADYWFDHFTVIPNAACTPRTLSTLDWREGFLFEGEEPDSIKNRLW